MNMISKNICIEDDKMVINFDDSSVVFELEKNHDLTIKDDGVVWKKIQIKTVSEVLFFLDNFRCQNYDNVGSNGNKLRYIKDCKYVTLLSFKDMTFKYIPSVSWNMVFQDNILESISDFLKTKSEKISLLNDKLECIQTNAEINEKRYNKTKELLNRQKEELEKELNRLHNE